MMIATLLALLAQQEAAPKAEKRTDFLRRIHEKDRAGFGDACRLAIGLSKGAPAEGDFAAVRQEALSLGLIEAGRDLPEAGPVDKGTVAFMLVKALGIKGGLSLSLFGPSRRYAFRECVFLRLMKGGTPGEFLTGRELIDILGNAEIYKRKGGMDAERK